VAELTVYDTRAGTGEAGKQVHLDSDITRVDEGKFVEEVGEPAFKLAFEKRRPFERVALLAILFWYGDQWSSIYNDHRDIFTRRDVRPDQCEETRAIDNQTPTYMRQIISGLTRNIPRLEGQAATTDPEDTGAAQLATRFLCWREIDDLEETLRERDLLWAMSTSESLRKTWYDPKGGEDRQGEIRTETVDFHHYLKDPYSIDTWPPKWLIEYDVRHVDWVKQQYGISVEPESVSEYSDMADRLALAAFHGGTVRRENPDGMVVVKRLSVPVGQKYPKGHTWEFVSSDLLRHHDLQVGIWPYAQERWFPTIGRLYPMGLMELLMTDQRRLNLLMSQMQEMQNRELRGDLISSGIQQKAREEIIDERSGRKQIMLPPGIEKYELLRYNPDWQMAQTARESLRQAMNEKVGMNKPTLGQDVGRSGVTLGELQIAREQDFEGLSWHLSIYVRDSLIETAKKKLALAQQFYKNVRLLPVFGQSRAGEVEYFLGADLRDTKHVIAIQRPHLTPAMLQQARTESFARGVLGPYQSDDHQLACRMELRGSGLDDLDDELAVTYGSFEDLQARVKELAQLKSQLGMVTVQQALAMAMAPPVQTDAAGNPIEPGAEGPQAPQSLGEAVSMALSRGGGGQPGQGG